MSQILYAVSIDRSNGDAEFRAPTEDDLVAVAAAEERLGEKRAAWEQQGIIPTEEFPSGNDMRPMLYGMTTWADFFTARQLLPGPRNLR